MPNKYNKNISKKIIISKPAGQKGIIHNVSLVGYGPTDVLRIKLTVLGVNQLSSIAFITYMSSTVQLDQLYPQLFNHENPQDHIYALDLDAMWSARTQIINVRRQSQIQINITVFSFDPPYRQYDVVYSLTIDPPGLTNSVCQRCTNGERYGNDCFCRNCLHGTSGKLCSRTIKQLLINTSINIGAYQYQYFSFKVNKTTGLQISVIGGNIQTYLQYQYFQGQVANFYNSIQTHFVRGGNSAIFSIDPQNKNVLLTIACMSNIISTVNVKYYDIGLSTGMIVLISVLCGLVFIFVVIIVVCVVYRKFVRNNRTGEQNVKVDIKNNKLSAQQIQRYFPSVILQELLKKPSQNNNNNSHIIPTGEKSFERLNLNNQQTKNIEQERSNHEQILSNSKSNQISYEQQCVICLLKINLTDLIKIGYCRHIVHGQCLVGWFNRQRNCPYCRKQFTRSNVILQYKKLIQSITHRRKKKQKYRSTQIKKQQTMNVEQCQQSQQKQQNEQHKMEKKVEDAQVQIQNNNQLQQQIQHKKDQQQQQEEVSQQLQEKQLFGLELAKAIYNNQYKKQVQLKQQNQDKLLYLNQLQL